MSRTSHLTVSAVFGLTLVLALVLALTALAALGIWRMEGAFESPPAVANNQLVGEKQEVQDTVKSVFDLSSGLFLLGGSAVCGVGLGLKLLAATESLDHAANLVIKAAVLMLISGFFLGSIWTVSYTPPIAMPGASA